MDKNSRSDLNLIKEIDTSLNSGEGILFIETNEHLRAVDAINDYADAKHQDMAVFKFVKGFQKVKQSGESGMICETGDPATAIYNYIDELSIKDILVIPLIDYMLSTSPALIQALMDANQILPSVSPAKRVICIHSIGYSLPSELNQCVTVKLQRPHEVEIKEAIDEVLTMVRDNGVEIDFTDEEFNTMINTSLGMTYQEINTSISSIIYQKSGKPSFEEVINTLNIAKVKTVERSSVLTLLKPTSIDQIGGLEVIKQDMQIFTQCMTEEAKSNHIDLPKGIFIAGNAGGGKSLMAHAVADIMGVPLIRFDVSRVFGGIVGSSEKSMKQALELINSVKNCVVLIDEIDKVFSTDGGNDSGTSARVLGTLLTSMQDDNNGAFYVFTANRTQGLPAELLRKGRIDELYSVCRPTYAEREEVFKIHLAKRNVEIPKNLHLAIAKSENYVPAEIESCIVKAMRLSYVESGDTIIETQAMLDILEEMIPLSTSYKEQFELMEEWAGKHAKPASLPDLTPTTGNVTTLKKRSRNITLN